MYVNDLFIALRDPKRLVNTLPNQYKVKFKVMGPISYHLGCYFFRENNCVLCSVPHKYIDKMVQIYITMTSKNPKIQNPFIDPL